MKNFVNAKDGVSKIFTAAIIELICAVVAAIALCVSGLQLPAGIMLTVSILALATLVLVIVAFILNLVGLSKAGKDSNSINNAFTFAICGIVIAIVCAILNAIPPIGQSQAGQIIYMCASIFTSFVQIIIVVYVCQGCSNLLSIRGEDKLAQSGLTTGTVFAVAYALGAILQLMSSMFVLEHDEIDVTGVLITIFAIVYLILCIVAYIKYLVFLGKAKNKLAD